MATKKPLKKGCQRPPKQEAKVLGKYPPKGGEPYKVQDGDNWTSLARRWNVGVSHLIDFNFGTGTPEEVNWYLDRYVGCVLPTDDGCNWRFSSAANPGIIYRPPRGGVPVPMPVPGPADEEKSFGSGRWIGVGFKAGGHVVGVGKDRTELFVFSWDDPLGKTFMLDLWTARLGPGLGASGGLVVAFIGNVYDPAVLRGYPLSGADFQVAVGPKWGAVFKMVGTFSNAALWAKTGQRASPVMISLAERSKAISMLKADAQLLAQLFTPKGYDPSVTVVDTPLGVGAEVSAYYGWGGCNPYLIRGEY